MTISDLFEMPLDGEKMKVKIGTHDGVFHADDILAISCLKTICWWCEFEIVRSRDTNILNACDLLIDVGGKYDGQKYFDHHQNKHLECSASLIWLAIFLYSENYEYAYKYISEKVLESVSDLDCDLQRAIENRGDNTLYYNISSFIGDLNYLENGFEKALELGEMFWESNLKAAKSHKKNLEVLDAGEIMGNIVILNEGVKIDEHKKWFEENYIQFVVHPQYNSPHWCISTVNSKTHPLPEKIEKAFFVHNARFIAIFKRKEDAISTAENLFTTSFG